MNSRGKKMTTATNSMEGKVCMITGCNSGIGKVAARELAKKGAAVVMVCRDPARGRAAHEEIRRVSGNSYVELMIADLSSQESIRRLADDFLQRHQGLHVLLNNAGVLAKERALTADGIETQLAVNLLAPFLLTNLLLDVLKANASARVVNVTSKMHRYGKIDLGNLQGEEKYSVWGAYNQAKLGLILVTYELARRLEGTGIAVNCLHPGVVASGIMRDFHRVARFFWDMVVLSPEKGAATSIYLTSSPEVEGISGKYFENKKQKKSSRESYDPVLAERLWDVCAEMTGIV